MWLNLIFGAGSGAEGAQLMLHKTTALEAHLQLSGHGVKKCGKAITPVPRTRMSRKIRGESYWPDSPSEKRRKNWLKN